MGRGGGAISYKGRLEVCVRRVVAFLLRLSIVTAVWVEEGVGARSIYLGKGSSLLFRSSCLHIYATGRLPF